MSAVGAHRDLAGMRVSGRELAKDGAPAKDNPEKTSKTGKNGRQQPGADMTRFKEAKCCIFSSSDLAHWTKHAEFTTAALPCSFEILKGSFYVGLGSRGLRNDFVDPDSGSILRIEH